MQGILYEEANFLQFAFITVILGGWAAWMTGKACAETWRGVPTLLGYLLLLGAGVRFIHHALFEGTMFSAQFYVVATAILLLFGFLGFRYTRTLQMVRQYHWLYEKVSPLSWREKT